MRISAEAVAIEASKFSSNSLEFDRHVNDAGLGANIMRAHNPKREERADLSVALIHQFGLGQEFTARDIDVESDSLRCLPNSFPADFALNSAGPRSA